MNPSDRLVAHGVVSLAAECWLAAADALQEFDEAGGPEPDADGRYSPDAARQERAKWDELHKHEQEARESVRKALAALSRREAESACYPAVNDPIAETDLRKLTARDDSDLTPSKAFRMARELAWRRALPGGDAGWTVITDDPATWPPDDKSLCLMHRTWRHEKDTWGEDIRSCEHGAHVRLFADEAARKNWITRWLPWPAAARGEKGGAA